MILELCEIYDKDELPEDRQIEKQMQSEKGANMSGECWSMMYKIGHAVRKARVDKRITAKDLGASVDLTEKEIWDLEQDGAWNLSLSKYYELAKRLNLPIDLDEAMRIGEEAGRIEHVDVEFFGKEVLANADDYLPIKNHLPHDLAVKLKTKNQWSDLGFVPKSDATRYDLHPDLMSRRTFGYYYEDDVIGNKGEWFEDHQAEVLDALNKNAGHNSLNPKRLRY